MNRDQAIADIRRDWNNNPRWKGLQRPYSAQDVYRLRGTVQIEYSLARRGAEKLWKLVNEEAFVTRWLKLHFGECRKGQPGAC